MESTALVSGEYSSGDENEDGRAKDANYDEVGMDMGSTSGSESENECNTESKEIHHSVRDGLFTSKEEYEAYQNQFRNVSTDKKDTSCSPKQEGADSEYGNKARNDSNINKQPLGDSIEKDEYGGYQPTTSKKASRESPHKQSSSPTREPRRRTDLPNKNENYKSNINDTASQKQPNKRQSLSEERLQDKLLLLSQEPSSSSGDYGGSSKQYSRRSRSRSKDRNRRSSSPKSHSRRRSRSRSRSRERKKDHDRHRSSHHRSSKHHHHRDHRDRHRDKYDGRDRNYRGNDGRRNRDRISEDHRQELRNKKLVNLGITSDAVLAAAAQSGSFDSGNSDAVAMRAQQMISKQLEAQVAKAKELTGVELPSYYNPSVINPLKYADQIKKRKLLWGSSGGGTGVKQSDATQEAPNPVEHNTYAKSSHEDTMQARKSIFAATAKKPEPVEKQSFNKWETTNFGDDKANDKFRRLMGIKSSTVPTSSDDKNPSAVTAVGDKTAKFFHEQEVQYERARAFTHTQRGTGFGFSECVQQQSEPSQPTSQNNVDTSSTHPQRSIGEKLGFVKKSL